MEITYNDLERAYNKFKIYRFIQFIKIMILFIFATIMFIILSFGYEDIFMYMLVFFIILLCFTFFYRPHIKMKKRYIEIYKKFLNYNILRKYCNNLSFNEKDGIPFSIIYEPNIIIKSREYYSNNLTSGTYKNSSFRIADIYLKNERRRRYSFGYDRKTRNNKEIMDNISNLMYTSVLVGNYMYFEFNKEFKENFTITRRSFSNIKLNNIVKNNNINSKYHIIYDGQNSLENFITPTLIEKIEHFQSKINSKILITFYNNQLHIGFDSLKNFLNAPSNLKIYGENIEIYLSESVKLLFDIIDYIQNNDIYFK